MAVAHELIGNRTYLVFGTGAVSLLTPHGTATASRLAHRAAKSPTSLGDVWDMFPDWDQFELDAPPNPARWYWVNWPEINARGNQYIIYDLQDGETPKRRQFKPTDEP